MSHRSIAIFVFCVSGVALLAVTLSTSKWLKSRPRWELSAVNSEKGVEISVFLKGKNQPVHSTMLEGREIAHDVHRVTVNELPPGIGESTFVDETIPPGRWVLTIDGVELDIMESRFLVETGEAKTIDIDDTAEGNQSKRGSIYPPPERIGDWTTIRERFESWDFVEFLYAGEAADGGSHGFLFTTI